MGEAWELESASAVSEATGGATHITTTAYRRTSAAAIGQAVRPITATGTTLVFGGSTPALKLIRSRSMSLSSWKVSLAISTAYWVRQ